MTATQKNSTIDQEEIKHFAKDSANWWDENGPFKPLHRLNPVRMHFIKEQICQHFKRDFNDLKSLKDLDIIDIGCGGGLVCEPLSRMGATVTGIDADENAINTAKMHAEVGNLKVEYICDDAANIDKKFDVVCALEIIEHVSDIPAFMEVCANRLKPDGLLIMSTLNRTTKSYALGIIGAEYIMRWVPVGTHDWNKFVKPSEIAAHARERKITPNKVTGLIFNPIKNEFELSDTDLDVNYLISLSRKL